MQYNIPDSKSNIKTSMGSEKRVLYKNIPLIPGPGTY